MNLQEMFVACQNGVNLFKVPVELQIIDDAIHHAHSGVSIRPGKVERRTIARTVLVDGWIVEKMVWNGCTDPDSPGPEEIEVTRGCVELQVMKSFLYEIFQYYVDQYVERLRLDAAAKEM